LSASVRHGKSIDILLNLKQRAQGAHSNEHTAVLSTVLILQAGLNAQNSLHNKLWIIEGDGGFREATPN